MISGSADRAALVHWVRRVPKAGLVPESRF
jgi:hypothetical protein